MLFIFYQHQQQTTFRVSINGRMIGHIPKYMLQTSIKIDEIVSCCRCLFTWVDVRLSVVLSQNSTEIFHISGEIQTKLKALESFLNSCFRFKKVFRSFQFVLYSRYERQVCRVTPNDRKTFMYLLMMSFRKLWASFVFHWFFFFFSLESKRKILKDL